MIYRSRTWNWIIIKRSKGLHDYLLSQLPTLRTKNDVIRHLIEKQVK